MRNTAQDPTTDQDHTAPHRHVLVLGATGKTGRRVATGLVEHGVRVHHGSRSATPPFDWNDESGWDACLEGVDAAYVSYAPDLAMPGATDAIAAFVDRARDHGLTHLVLLSGRGEPEAEACEAIVQESGMAWTVVRASWFMQNFSEGAFTPMVREGRITLPAGEIAEPFVDIDDLAAVALAALTEPGHAGRIYEVTGPRALTFAQVAEELSRATGREIVHVEVPHETFIDGVKGSGAPQEVAWMLDYLFSTVLDGRNSAVVDGVERALGRPPRDLSTWARETAATGVWGGAA
jgi:uncharacterized protein YbjT (DUF2867 family)